MAQRRMFSNRITDSAKFLKMPLSSQALYFHLGLHADDDGVVEAFSVMRQTGAVEDDLRLLVAKGFVNVLNNDLVAYITDWNENNRIRADRKVDSIYKDLLLKVLPATELTEPKPRADTGKPTGRPMDNQWTDNGPHRLGKDRLVEDSLGQDSEEHSAADATPPTSLEDEFNVIWDQYPNKKGKKQAYTHYKAWRKKSVKNTNDYLLDRLRLYKTDLAANTWKQPMNGATWFNGRFDDDYQVPKTSGRANSFELENRDVTEDDLPW